MNSCEPDITLLSPGQRIRYLRCKLGLSQIQLSRRVGFENRSCLSRFETGNRAIREPNLSKVAVALGTTPAWILTGVETAATIPVEPPVPTTVGVLKDAMLAGDRLTITADRGYDRMACITVHRHTAERLRELKYKTRWSIAELADALIAFAADRLDII